MLLDDFFKIINLQQKENTFKAELEINAAHKIFEGHFPGQPVTPGVCMMQMIKEIIEKGMDHKTQLIMADEMKFLSVIDPRQNNRITAEIKYTIIVNKISVMAAITKDSITHFKFKGSFLLV